MKSENGKKKKITVIGNVRKRRRKKKRQKERMNEAGKSS